MLKKNLTKPNYILVAILLAGLLVRLFLFFHFQNQPKFFYDDDSKGYVQLAENLRTGHGFSWDEKAPYEANSFRTPGYPAFLLTNRALFGDYRFALLAQIILVVLTAYLIFLLAKEWKTNKLGYWAAAIFLFMPFSIMVSLRYLTQPLFTFLLTLAVWLWLKHLKNKSIKYFIGAVIILPLLALVRPIAFYLPIVFILSLVISFWPNPKEAIKKIAILIAVFFTILSPWLARNYSLFGKFSLSSITPYQLYFYDTPAVYATTHKVSYDEARAFLEKDIKQYLPTDKFEDYMKYKSEDMLNKRSWHYLLESRLSLLVTRANLFFKFFVRDGIHYWASQCRSCLFLKFPSPILSAVPIYLERSILGILFLGFLAFSWQSLRSKNNAQVFISLVVVYFALLTGAVASAGLRFPVEPLIILAGLAGWQGALRFFVKSPPKFSK